MTDITSSPGAQSNVSRRLRLAARPIGEPTPTDFELVEGQVPEPGDGELVVEVTHISVDPAMRGWISATPSYMPPVEIGEVMRALAIGRVKVSRNDNFTEGELVHGMFGVQEHALSNGADIFKLEPLQGISVDAHLGILGMPGMTAYFGLRDVGRVNSGDTVLVSGASGGVGTVVGQLAKIYGARAVGIAGGAKKCRMLVDELGFDAAVDYKAGDVSDQLLQCTPNGVDVFFDNVGGEILDQGLARLAHDARVVICGAITQYNAIGPARGPSNYLALLVQRASMTGFVVSDYVASWPAAISEMSTWLLEGRLNSVEDTIQGGIDAMPGALLSLFNGHNAGKLVLELQR